MYKVLRRVYWWPGVKKDVNKYMCACLSCQRVKAEHKKVTGLLQMLSIPERKWEEATIDFINRIPPSQTTTIDFINRLPPSQTKRDATWVVVHRLTKSVHLIPVNVIDFMGKLTRIYTQEVVR
jgi:hypothetical protein